MTARSSIYTMQYRTYNVPLTAGSLGASSSSLCRIHAGYSAAADSNTPMLESAWVYTHTQTHTGIPIKHKLLYYLRVWSTLYTLCPAIMLLAMTTLLQQSKLVKSSVFCCCDEKCCLFTCIVTCFSIQAFCGVITKNVLHYHSIWQADTQSTIESVKCKGLG